MNSEAERFRRAARLARELGSDRPLGSVHLVVFVPSVDRAGRPVPQNWVRRTLEMLGLLFRGATAYPRGVGVWRNDRDGGRLVYDRTTIVFTYVAEADFTPFARKQLKLFLHRMGREANQGEIGLAVDNAYIAIDRFEEEESS